MSTSVYGELNAEKLAADSEIAHKIVSEIGQFGVSDRQRLLVIYYLTLELEDIDAMKSLSSYIKELKGDSLFISKLYGSEEVT